MRTRYGLLVGINRYDYGRSLTGCINDICDIKEYMTDCLGYDKTNIRILKNNEATRKSIIECINEKVNQLKTGDSFWFHFSGQGTRCYNQKERDNFDCICPRDMPYNFGFNDLITESDLKEHIFAKSLSGVSVLFTFDLCNSVNTKDIYKTGKPRYVHPVNKDIMPRESMSYSSNVGFKSLRGLCSIADVSIMTACKSDQSAADDCFNRKPNGAFTYYLLRELYKANADSKLSDIIQSVENSVKINFNQNPQYYGNSNIKMGDIIADPDGAMSDAAKEMLYV